MKSRGQVAMEFIMTYGWAIIVVLAAIGALAYFGVLSPGKYLPEKCLISQGFGCRGALLTIDGVSSGLNVSVTYSNGLGEGVTISGVSVRLSGGDFVSCNVPAATISAGDTFEVTCGDVITGASVPGVGEAANVAINMTYTTTKGVYTRVAQGEISGNVQ